MIVKAINLEKKLKLKFIDQKILIKSLTHKSYDSINNNEKNEFLGDRVLGLIIAKKLLEIYPKEKEGVLDKKFASLVNKKKCLEIAKKIGLEKYILIFNPKNRNQIDSKTKLQEYSLKIFKVLPIYKLISNTGPRHKPLFKVAVKLKNTKFFNAQGCSKKDAEQNAASLCMENVLKK